MIDYTSALETLIGELLAVDKQIELANILASESFDYEALYRFDLQLGGPSIKRINAGNRGRYHIDDRDVFRPIQYLDISFRQAKKYNDLAWKARDIVEMSCLHIEGLVKKISRTPWLPLGRAVKSPMVDLTLPPDLRDQVRRLVPVYNASKHEMSQEKDTHLFSPQDAVLAYIVARLLGLRLYPYARLKTDITIFDVAGPNESEG